MEKILMGSVVGFVLFTLISYILLVLNIPFFIIPITLLGIILTAKTIIKDVRKMKLPNLTVGVSSPNASSGAESLRSETVSLHPQACAWDILRRGIKIKFNVQTILILIVFTIGIAGQLAVISPSGTFQNGDLVFWSAHGHDASWHIALMEEMKKGYPFGNPSFAGEKLVNYHFFSDIAPAIISKYLPISNLDSYFRLFPFVYSLFLGASAYFLTKKITDNFSASIWATIFTYFAGSFGFIITYLKNQTIGGESIFWATQPQSSSGNPPQIVSGFLVLTSLYFLFTFLQKKSKTNFVICILLFGTLSAFKIYAGVVLLGALVIAGIWQVIRERNFQLLLLSVLSGTLAAILYFPNTTGSTSFLIFEPWWYIRTMIVEPSRLNLLDWELRRQTYIYENNWKRVIWLEGLGFLIFFFGNLGMRFIGLWDFTKQGKSSLKNYFNLVFVTIILLSIVLPLLFLQKGVASNTSQFLQYFILLFGILAGITTSRITAKFNFLSRSVIIPVIIILMIPTQVGLLNEFYGIPHYGSPQHSRPAFAKISSFELQALSYVKNNTSKDSIILTPPYNQYLNLGGTIPNIWDWFDTSYVAAFSGRKTYFDDYEQADIMGYDYKPRFEIKKTIFESENENEVKTAISKTNADIVYFPKVISPKVNLRNIGLIKIFENQEVEVWEMKFSTD